jgi:hypothetical protein
MNWPTINTAPPPNSRVHDFTFPVWVVLAQRSVVAETNQETPSTERTVATCHFKHIRCELTGFALRSYQ